jgi:integrase
MAFITDKEKLKSGLIIFRRGDVTHRNFYCRIKLPKEDRYKTIALGTADRQTAHDQAFDLDADIRFRIKHDVPVFNRPFRQVAEEYPKLHSFGRKWIKAATSPQDHWYRTICYNFMFILCNTGMRPPEARNLRWRDIMAAKDRDGREIVVLSVQGKGKSRKLVAPKSVGDYLDRVRELSKATKPDDPVFTIINGKPAKYLYRKTWRRATSERQQS